MQEAAQARQLAMLTSFAKKQTFAAAGKTFVVRCHSTLFGHEDWVHAVAWQPRSTSCSTTPQLLSSSMDRTIMKWEHDPSSGLWMCVQSMGDAGVLRKLAVRSVPLPFPTCLTVSLRLSRRHIFAAMQLCQHNRMCAGADCLGYFSGMYSPGGEAVLANGYTGALHLWQQTQAEASGSRGAATGVTAVPSLVGHTGAVVDACWAVDGACLLTAGADQTVRITTQDTGGHWLECARPQVHGHDFHAVVAIPTPGQQTVLYASASEEKVIRIFQAPGAFLQSLALLRGSACAAVTDGPMGAMVPALGLSNKAVVDGEAARPATDAGPADYSAGPDFAPNQQPTVIEARPLHQRTFLVGIFVMSKAILCLAWIWVWKTSFPRHTIHPVRPKVVACRAILWKRF